MDDFYKRKICIYIALFLLVVSAGVYSEFSRAEQYTWTYQEGNRAFPGYSSALEACQAHVNPTQLARKGAASLNQFYCQYINTQGNFQSSANSYVYRVGTTCGPGKTYNPATGDCDPDNQCESKIGQSHSFGGDLGQMEVCVGGCLVVADMGSADPIVTYKKEVSEKTYWWVNGVFSGEQCNSAPPSDSSPPPPTSSEKDRECTPTSTNESGAQVSSCTETEVEVDNQGCVDKGGFVGSGPDGVMRCIAAKKGPKATETKTKTEVESKTNPDGSKDEKTTKTKDKKVCSGAGSCSSSTTTNVSNNSTNADGSAGNSSSSCSGAECASEGTGSGKGNGEGESDGEGEGEEDGDGPEGPTGTLQQGEPGSFAEGISEWEQRLSDARAELDDKVEQLSSQFRGVFDLDLSAGAGSLPCETFPISFGKTSTTLRLCPADYSEQLSYLRFALLLGAAALGAIIILRG